MKRTPTLLLALLTTFVMAWTGTVYAQSCSAGKTKFDAVCKTCHTAASKSQKGVNEITTALISVPSMQGLYPSVVNDSDIDNIALYLFFFPTACPIPTPNLAATPPSINFVNVPNGSTSPTTTVTLTNSGDGSATGLVYSNSNSTKWIVTGVPGSACGATILAGASCSFNVAYRPAAAGANDVGTYSASGTKGSFSINLSGSSPTVVVPTPANLQSTPGSVAFGNVTVGSSSSAQAISIRNLGTTDAASVTFANSNSAKFAISGQSCSTLLAGGATCVFNLTYTPSAVASDSGSITVGYTGGSVIIGLSGAGTAGTPPPPPPPTAQTVNLIEYYHAAFGHYFVTYLQAEIDKLDNGTFAGWARTGKQFKAWTSSGTGLAPVCRFFTNYIDFAPKSSHFYTPDAPECTVVQANKVWQYEGQVFYTQSPSVTGVCPANTVSVYRMYNNGQSGAPNHRYTTDLSVRAEMIAVTKMPAPWIPEGAGTIGVIMCAPP